MRIEHIAIWTKDLELLKKFYETYFGGISEEEKYTNPKTNFESYFLTFSSGSRLELMFKPTIIQNTEGNNLTGIAHIAFSTGSRENVHALTERLRQDNYEIIGEPRETGDGYYESVVLDPDGNHIEITI